MTALLLQALGILTSFDPLDILVVFVAFTVDGVLYVLSNMHVIAVPLLPCRVVSVGLRRAGQRVLLLDLLFLLQDLAGVAIPRLERLLILLLRSVLLAPRLEETREEQVARDESRDLVEVGRSEVRDVVAAGVHVVVTASIKVVVVTSHEVVGVSTGPNNSSVSMQRETSEQMIRTHTRRGTPQRRWRQTRRRR